MFTYDTSTDVGKVRLIITDNEECNAILQDDEIEAFLSLEGGSIRLAAASALDTIASNEALVCKVISTMGLSVNGPAVADSLRKHADRLREQESAADIDSTGGFEIAENPVDEFSLRAYILKLEAEESA